MKSTLLLLLSIVGLFALPGCTLTPESKAKIAAVGKVVGNRALAIASTAVLNAAINSADRDKKGGFLDDVAGGLRQNVATLITADDVRQLVRAFTPEKRHWEDLAAKLAKAYAEAQPQNAEERKAILLAMSQGLEQAAVEQK